MKKMICAAALMGSVVATAGNFYEADIIVYGSTPAALSCAVQAKRMGKTCVIVSPETRIGGLTTGGLGQTDIGNKSAFGGIALEFYRDVATYYRSDANWTRQRRSDYLPDGQCAGTKGADSMWTFEPSAALKILTGWERRDGLVIHRGKLLDRERKAKVSGEGEQRKIVSFVTLDGTEYRGKMFVDATYEGDLLAAAGVTYTVGREANAVYGETISGIQRKGAVSHQFHPGVSPYVKEGDPKSGLLPCVEKDVSDPDGTGDKRVQAYCFRMCLTDVPENRIPFKKPANYREIDYELLFREFAQSQAHPELKGHGFLDFGAAPNIMSMMPNRKTDTNNRTAFSTDFIGQNYAWPEASYEERERILKAHLDYQQGLMWTLANHPRIPKATRDYYSKWGTCKDEFEDGLGDGWQRQLYVREARRLVGDYVVSQMDCLGKRVAKRPVALAAYGMDSHHCRRYVDEHGDVRNEGDIQDWTAGGRPYPIDYGALVPKRGECANLLVPVCVSASHMAFGSIRMEPVFFALGQVAATAAAQAIDAKCAVQDLPYAPLRKRLLADGQRVEVPLAEKDLFAEGGFFVGCNYWSRHAGMYMWSDWRPDVVERELAELAKNGVEVMRVFPLWSDFQPLTGDCYAGGDYRSFRFRDNKDLPNPDGVDPEMMKRFRFLCDVAERNGMRLIVGIVTGWMSGRQFVPPVFEQRDVTVDPQAILWQTRFVRHFVRAMKDHPAIAAWDYGNECNCLSTKDSTQESFYNWMNHLAMTIRLEDPKRPIVSGMHGLSTSETALTPIRLNAEVSDILCTHPYCFYVPGCGKEAFNTMRTELHPTAESLLYRDLGGKPCFLEEIGSLGAACNSDARSAAGLRVTLFSAWANDLKGCLWWCNSDQEGLSFPPYTLTACERELGLLRQDWTPKPVMLEMKKFQEFRKTVPITELPKARTDSVIVVPEKDSGWIPGFGAYLLARQAGLNPSFAGAEHELPDAKLYIVCSAESDMSYTYPAQCRIFDRARAGATVVLIYCGASRFTHLKANAGVEADYGTKSPIERRVTLNAYKDRPFVCADALTCRLLPAGAEILGQTADGEPALTRFPLGKGQVILCNSPIDRQTIARTDVVTGERVVPYYLVLREAMRLAGQKRFVERGDCPSVGITEHPWPDGSGMVMAINFEPRAVTCPIKMNGRLGRIWRGDVKADRLVIPPNDAVLFEFLP